MRKIKKWYLVPAKSLERLVGSLNTTTKFRVDNGSGVHIICISKRKFERDGNIEEEWLALIEDELEVGGCL